MKFFQKLPPCVVGMEACASSHYWGREIVALGHDVRLMPPTRVKPCVKWGKKNDQVDAAACCEAVQRPCMQFVSIKTPDQQAALLLHRARKMLVNQRTQLGNAIRAHLAEFGIVTAKGEGGVSALLAMVSNPEDKLVPAAIRPILAILVEYWRAGDARIAALDRQIAAWHKSHDDSRRVATIPQIRPIVASALAATAGDAARFKNGRQFAAWLGPVPSQNSTGGKERLGHITKTGDTYVRQLLVVAAIGMIRRVRVNPAISPWFAQLLARKTPKQATVALANKMARMAWAILAKGGVYKAPDLATAAEAA